MASNRFRYLLRCGTLRQGLSAWLLALAAIPAVAQQQAVPNAVALESEAQEIPRYTVELIVFEYVGNAASTPEIFEPAAPLTDFTSDAQQRPGESNDAGGPGLAVAGLPPEDAETEIGPADEELGEIRTYEQAGLKSVDPADYQLNNAYRKLESLDAYRPLLHTAWTQPTLEKEQTEPIKLRRIGNPPLRLDGTVSLYLSRYLHLVVDLSLEDQAPQRMTATEERLRLYGDRRDRRGFGFDPEFVTPSIFYRIDEDRIVRNNELRYYDHPKFGVLAKITKVEEQKPDPLDTTVDLLPGAN